MARIELHWDPFDQTDPGPCINVIIMNSADVIRAGRAIGLEYPEPRPIRALLDTGASVTVVNDMGGTLLARPELDDVERFLARPYLRRYVTWCR